MKKLLVILSILVAIAAIAPADHKVYAEDGDLCGGTNGNGEIISVGSDTFTLKLNEGGQKGGGDLIVTLADRATIEASTGRASVSDLRTGDHVTLVGDNHRDGTFTADAVMVCGGTEVTGTQGGGAGQVAPIAVRNKNPEAYEKVSDILTAATLLLFGLIWLGTVMFLWLRRGKSLTYLLFFTIFYVYVYKVLDYTLLQFQSLVLLQHFVPDLMLNGFKDGTNVNLIPLATLTFEDLKTSLLNVLMLVPFGFGLPFISDFRFKQVVTAGLLFSISIEFLQLVTGLVAGTTFRVADINDLIFNTAGVAVGYVLFALFVLVYRRLLRSRKISANPIFRYIAERPQLARQRHTKASG